MKALALLLSLLMLVAACGVDGEPIPPVADDETEAAAR